MKIFNKNLHGNGFLPIFVLTTKQKKEMNPIIFAILIATSTPTATIDFQSTNLLVVKVETADVSAAYEAAKTVLPANFSEFKTQTVTKKMVKEEDRDGFTAYTLIFYKKINEKK